MKKGRKGICLPLYVCICFLFTSAPCGAQSGPNLLRNPGFEEVYGTLATGWMPFEQGYSLDIAIRRGAGKSIRCENSSVSGRRGAHYRLVLNQKSPTPILVTGWSRAENVSGFANNDYSIYLDLEYMDGSPLWGQTAPFDAGTHEWQQRKVLVFPTKPVRAVNIFALFRHHTGTAWFDDFTAIELSGNNLFDSQPLAPPRLPTGAAYGWFARDVTARSPVLPLCIGAKRRGSSRQLGLRLETLHAKRSDPSWRVRIVELTGRTRAVTLYYVERFPARNALWWNDIRHRIPVGDAGERANLTRVGVGANGAISLYPFGCITGIGAGRALGIPPGLGPRIARIGYHAGAKLFYVAFDVALTGENRFNRTAQGYGTAEAAVVRYDVDPKWGFRSAALKYYRLYPQYYTRRAKAEGIWIPFTDPSTVERVEDFGIAYHEGDNSIESDDRLDILSFRYTEPMTYWMPMPPEMPRTYEKALTMVEEHARGSDPEKRKWAQAVRNSASCAETGRYNVEFQNAPWTNGAVWVLNPNPALPCPPNEWTKARLSYTRDMAEQTYRRSGKGGQDGEYLDSIEGWADILDFRPESRRCSRAPLTFTTDSGRPVVPTWFSVYELAAFMREDLHRRGKLLMANATPWRIHAFSPLLDVMGTEVNWLPGGRWAPDSDAVFNLRRTLSFRKPYLLLQNTDFDRFGPDLVEKYFQRSLFYGVYPSMFSVDASNNPYWQTPRWYNRDRHLFIRYIPIIRRLSAAGWEPITHARTSHPRVYIERFGSRYLTLLNDSNRQVEVRVHVDLPRFLRISSARQVTLREVFTGEKMATGETATPVRFRLTLKPEETRVVQIVIEPRSTSYAASRHCFR